MRRVLKPLRQVESWEATVLTSDPQSAFSGQSQLIITKGMSLFILILTITKMMVTRGGRSIVCRGKKGLKNKRIEKSIKAKIIKKQRNKHNNKSNVTLLKVLLLNVWREQRGSQDGAGAGSHRHRPARWPAS